MWAGFSDGTLRVFDLTGRFSMETRGDYRYNCGGDHMDNLGGDWDDDVVENSSSSSSRNSSSEHSLSANTTTTTATSSRSYKTMKSGLVASKWHQRFGAVACQIHARGVHTDLLTYVDVCGEYVFAGVPRGAIELYAVSIRHLEQQAATVVASNDKYNNNDNNILDSIQVYVHADAKLKGLGACTQLPHASRPTYLLLTGKGIKNIHIWKFQPPLSTEEDAVWEQLYDTQTNGNTIRLLSFYRNPHGKLWGVSQSDAQKLRLWDLSLEEQAEPTDNPNGTAATLPKRAERPKRPPYQDVANSQCALAIAGGYGVCGGPTMYNQLSIVSLDQPKSAYNHTELALPGSQGGTSSLAAGRGRQRRGDLKQLVNVATLPNDSNHALLELDDVSNNKETNRRIANEIKAHKHSLT